MICPNCNTKIRNRDVSTACTKCRYQFTFKPNDLTGLSDYFLIKKLKSVSGDGTYYFTTKQLYYFLLKAKAQELHKSFFVLGFILFFFGIIFSFGKHFIGYVFVISSIISIIYGRVAFRQWRFPYDISSFKENVIKKWELQRGKIQNMITDSELSFNLQKHPDIMDYAFDCLIITGDNEIANFLIKNDFHFKNKAAIVSSKKYPSHLFPYVIDQVKKNTEIPVFLVHNADILYANMKHDIQTNWFYGYTVKIYDLGLHPSQVMKSKKIISEKRKAYTLPSANLTSYNEKEQEWLKTGHYTDLAIIAPQKLLNALEFAVNTHKEKGDAEFEKVMSSVFIVGLGLNSRLKDGFEIDFGDDFG